MVPNFGTGNAATDFCLCGLLIPGQLIRDFLKEICLPIPTLAYFGLYEQTSRRLAYTPRHLRIWENKPPRHLRKNVTLEKITPGKGSTKAKYMGLTGQLEQKKISLDPATKKPTLAAKAWATLKN